MGKSDFGIIAKVETNDAVRNLAKVLLAGLDLPNFGILIARGDLAVEMGFENLPTVQEDILCMCEAAHIPVVTGLILYLNHRELPDDLRPSRISLIVTALAGLFFAAFAVIYLVSLIAPDIV